MYYAINLPRESKFSVGYFCQFHDAGTIGVVEIHPQGIKKKLPSRSLSVLTQCNNVRKPFFIIFLWLYFTDQEQTDAHWVAVALPTDDDKEINKNNYIY